MRTISVSLITLLFICLGFSQLHAETGTESEQVSAAQVWLSHIDNGNYSGSWDEASLYFRRAVTEQNWVQALDGVRKPLGNPASRKIVNTSESSTLPGVPDGRYAVISFQTAFEHKKSAIETVTLMFENDGKWRAAGYFIK
jgi:hypothetical protein